ncbi:bile acid:sodium symporter family protein [Arcobacter sp. F2176]|uniref:bile acid:sodium symporter family protein n=2 Tax=Arcobacter TaxID=28196 RepID=UPI00215A03E6|nr:bile acid:sodium symporter [Arcobacter sp. F2176]
MPLAAFVISKAFDFSTELTFGMILVGAVSDGTASNVIAYLAKADVALSISMTVVSILLSIVITPYLTLFYVGQNVPVPASSILSSILKIVLAQVVIGVIVNYFFNKYIEKNQDLFASLSIISIVFIIAIVVVLNESKIHTVGL